MSAFAKAAWDAFGSLVGAVVGRYLLNIASVEPTNLSALKFCLSVTGLAIGYLIFLLKVANAFLTFNIEQRSQKTKYGKRRLASPHC